MTLTSTITNQLVATLADTAPTGDLATAAPGTSRVSVTHGVRLATGTGAGQADLMFSDTRTLGDGSSEDLDLAGVLTDAFGATITNVRIKAIYIQAAAANTTDLTIGGGANDWSTLLNGTIVLRPGGSFQAIAGVADATAWTVTAGTGDSLQVANSAGASADYDIVVIGASA